MSMNGKIKKISRRKYQVPVESTPALKKDGGRGLALAHQVPLTRREISRDLRQVSSYPQGCASGPEAPLGPGVLRPGARPCPDRVRWARCDGQDGVKRRSEVRGKEVRSVMEFVGALRVHFAISSAPKLPAARPLPRRAARPPVILGFCRRLSFCWPRVSPRRLAHSGCLPKSRRSRLVSKVNSPNLSAGPPRGCLVSSLSLPTTYLAGEPFRMPPLL